MQKTTAIGAAAIAVVIGSLAPAGAGDRYLSGSEAHSLLAGRKFEFVCVDGTRGQASYGTAGTAKAVYRVPTSRDTAMEEQDEGLVRPVGGDLCIRWQRLNDGREGCYRMTERSPGRYRISTNDNARWCELSVRGG